LEKEHEILDYVGEALKNPKPVTITKPKPIDVDEFKSIINESIKKEKKIIKE
jgi:hypothetical protein